MEKTILNWFVERRKTNCPINEELLKANAKMFHANSNEWASNFNASFGWLSGFKARFGIQLLKVSSEQAVEPFTISAIIFTSCWKERLY